MVGMTDVTVESNNQVRQLPIYVVKGNYPAILGRGWLDKLRLNWQLKKATCTDPDLAGVMDMVMRGHYISGVGKELQYGATVGFCDHCGTDRACLLYRPDDSRPHLEEACRPTSTNGGGNNIQAALDGVH
ncbi:hypothetical protein N1851_006976 [Merluccius polli]|uniref:Uncharacterized protein n=1 Tax=Merluccius polli TaxID=89951 RepID=A0AA47N3T8_MERPO|nr:hypothetical protein N1851_006976 [Merluccius polli]